MEATTIRERDKVKARMGAGGQQGTATRLAVRGERGVGLSVRAWGLRWEEVVGREKDMGPTLGCLKS